MVTIFLHGMLGRKFGKKWELEVASVTEAIHAIDINLNGELRSYLGQNQQKQYKIKVGKAFIEEDVEITGPCGKSDIHIMPVIKGRNSGVGKILTALAIIVVSFYYPPAAAYLAAHGSVALAVYSTAASLFIGGVSQLLAPKVNFDTNTDNTTNQQSFDFNGNQATVMQGNPVPVAYGRVLIHPLPISVAQFYEDFTAGGVASTSSTVDSSQDAGFDGRAGNGNPPINPVGQNVTVTPSINLYLGNFSSATSTPNIGPSVIPGKTSAYQTNSP